MIAQKLYIYSPTNVGAAIGCPSNGILQSIAFNVFCADLFVIFNRLLRTTNGRPYIRLIKIQCFLRSRSVLLSLRSAKRCGNLTQHIWYSTHQKPVRTGRLWGKCYIRGINVRLPRHFVPRNDIWSRNVR